MLDLEQRISHIKNLSQKIRSEEPGFTVYHKQAEIIRGSLEKALVNLITNEGVISKIIF